MHWLKIMLDSFRPFLAAGLLFTVPLSLLSFALGLALGFLTALA
jgi:cystine transport system permease protein